MFNVNRCYYYGNYESKHHGSCTSERQNLYVMYQGLVFFIGLYRKQNKTSVYSTFICSTTIKAFLNKINQQIHGIHNFFFPTIKQYVLVISNSKMSTLNLYADVLTELGEKMLSRHNVLYTWSVFFTFTGIGLVKISKFSTVVLKTFPPKKSIVFVFIFPRASMAVS